MVEKYFAGRIPSVSEIKDTSETAKSITIKLQDLKAKEKSCLGKDLNFNTALEAIWELINMANKYIEDKKPWELFKQNKTDELKEFIGILVKVIREVAENLYPFMPSTSNSILEQIGITEVKKMNPLFPRIDHRSI
jgi:methionyl-tRNA synthetase